MRTPITIVAIMLIAMAFTGCGTITNSQVHHASTQELLLERYQLAVRTNRSAWGNAYDDWSDDMRKKEAVERELMRRGVINPQATPQQIYPTPQVVWGVPGPAVL